MHVPKNKGEKSGQECQALLKEGIRISFHVRDIFCADHPSLGGPTILQSEDKPLMFPEKKMINKKID